MNTTTDTSTASARRAVFDERLANLARAVYRGDSNPPLIRRAGRLADEIAGQHPDLAHRLRTALTTRWESLGDRFDKVQAIRRELAARPLADDESTAVSA